MTAESPYVLRELAKQFKGRLARCKFYDANVCTWRYEPDKPWDPIPVSGEPFSHELRFIHRKRKVTVFGNTAYAYVSIKGGFPKQIFTINENERNAFIKCDFAEYLSIRGKRYPVFAETSKLSTVLKLMLSNSKLMSLVYESDLRKGESFHFNRGEIGTYLKQPDAEHLSKVIELMIDFAREIEIAEEKVDLKLLPVQFRPLIALIEKWAVDDDGDRGHLLASAKKSTLRALVDEVTPYFGSIDSYLDSFGDNPPTDYAAALGRLAECALEARQQLTDER